MKSSNRRDVFLAVCAALLVAFTVRNVWNLFCLIYNRRAYARIEADFREYRRKAWSEVFGKPQGEEDQDEGD